ncbi:TetR/AcrR family transcriptional regulator [Patulibacter sp. NPDC049589]|uniref:TetR/AcrR family transcriptional regulator n=1 Tax=Patulibacter sp. NPDC049589 TaxID=3154731 RepID=UPI00343CD6BE
MPDDVASSAPAAPHDERPADRLPRGRHGLSREEVVRSQRKRIIRGMAAAMADDGYVGTSVTAILKRAGVSRQTFYEQFASKEECFAATYAWAAETVLEHTVRAAGDASGDDGHDPIDRMLAFYLRGLAAAPEFARVLLIETYAAGPDALESRIALQRRFATQIGDVLGASTADDRFACEALVGAVSSLVTARLALGDTAGLLALQEPLAALARREAAAFGGGA